MEKIHVVTTYSISAETEVELPEGKTVADIENVWVKWGTIHVEFKGDADGASLEASESPFDVSDMDCKRPGSMEVLKDDGEGGADWDQILFQE
jgi:hypothetical protein